MPIYEYECLECGAQFDRLQHVNDPAPTICPNGHTNVRKLFSQPAIIFKGSGFYVTDNGRNGHSSTSTSGRKQHKEEPASGRKTEKTDSGS